jgi:capsular polysaccharide transport system permease protein
MGKQDKTPLPAQKAPNGGAAERPASREVEARIEPPAPATAMEWAADTLQLDFARVAEQRRKSFLLRLLIFVGLPTLLAALYVYVYATPRYVSEIQIVYQSSSPQQAASGGLLSTFLGSSSSGLDMQRVISSYVSSDTLLKKLNDQLDLRGHYSNSKIDWIDRLRSKATDEDFLTYFRSRVSVNAMIGGYDVIDVEAFDPKMAATLAQAMADDVDKMVEDLTERERRDEMNFAASELARTQRDLLAAKLQTTAFRNAHRQFDPMATAVQLETTVVGGLETQLSQARSVLASRRTVLSPDSPTIRSLEMQVAAIEQQISAERTRLASGGAGADAAKGASAPYSDLVAQYTTLTQNEQFAIDAYTSAKQAFDLARADAQRKQNYVEAFVKPNLPQKSTSPNPTATIFATFVVALLAYAVGSLIVSAFRDQAGA